MDRLIQMGKELGYQGGPTKDRSSGPSQLNRKLYAGAIIKSEV